MTHHDHDYDLFGEMFREATEAHLATEDNREDIHRTFNDLVDAAIGSGDVIITGTELKRMTRDYHWVRLNAKAGRATQSYLRQLATKQIHLFEVDEVLDTVITAGDSRRTTIRNITIPDIERMTESRKGNYDKQKQAWQEWRDVIAPTLTAWVTDHGSIPNAITAGDVPLRADEAPADTVTA